MSELEEKTRLRSWYGNLPLEVQGKLDADYADQHEGLFYRGPELAAIAWLKENHEDLHEQFEKFELSDQEAIEHYRALARERNNDELDFEPNARVSLGEEPGAWVQGWVWISNLITAKVAVWQDDEPEGPNAWDGWTMYSFNTKHSHFKDPGQFDQAQLEEWFEKGSAYKLGYYEHGGSLWFLKGENPVGAGDVFDSVEYAGVLIWEGSDIAGLYGKDKSKFEESARTYCKTFTQWENGQVYGFTVKAAPGVTGISAGGFYSIGQLAEEVAESIPPGAEIELSGDNLDEVKAAYEALNDA